VLLVPGSNGTPPMVHDTPQDFSDKNHGIRRNPVAHARHD
jgi:hypothetical protein